MNRAKKDFTRHVDASIIQVEHLAHQLIRPGHTSVTALHDLRVGLRKTQVATRLLVSFRPNNELTRVLNKAKRMIKVTCQFGIHPHVEDLEKRPALFLIRAIKAGRSLGKLL